MAWAAVRSKAVGLLLLIVTPIVEFCNCSMFCFVSLCVHSIFAIISMGEERVGCFALFVFHVSRDCCVGPKRMLIRR